MTRGRRKDDIFIEIYFDVELDELWHITVWRYTGEFDPDTARYTNVLHPFGSVHGARYKGRLLRGEYIKRGYRVRTSRPSILSDFWQRPEWLERLISGIPRGVDDGEESEEEAERHDRDVALR